MIIIDTTVWIDYFRGAHSPHADWLEANLVSERLGLTDLILCEVLQGITVPAEFDAVLMELSRFMVFATGGIEVAVAAARNYRQLRTEGRTVRGTIDLLIATFCLLEGHALLHNDRNYDSFETLLGLKVVHP
ncbi:MAG TPA: PIN domain nuclease [Nitrospiraceae bacterium]|nr:PIN domain nuclease [Nitrospiraceae bacterium]